MAAPRHSAATISPTFCVGSDSNKQLTLFTLRGGKLYGIQSSNPGSLGPLFPSTWWPFQMPAAGLAGGLTICENSTGGLTLFAIDGEGHLQCLYQKGPGAWFAEWQLLSDSSQCLLAPAVVQDTSGKLVVFIATANDSGAQSITCTWETGQNLWHEWTGISPLLTSIKLRRMIAASIQDTVTQTPVVFLCAGDDQKEQFITWTNNYTTWPPDWYAPGNNPACLAGAGMAAFNPDSADPGILITAVRSDGAWHPWGLAGVPFTAAKGWASSWFVLVDVPNDQPNGPCYTFFNTSLTDGAIVLYVTTGGALVYTYQLNSATWLSPVSPFSAPAGFSALEGQPAIIINPVEFLDGSGNGPLVFIQDTNGNFYWNWQPNSQDQSTWNGWSAALPSPSSEASKK